MPKHVVYVDQNGNETHKREYTEEEWKRGQDAEAIFFLVLAVIAVLLFNSPGMTVVALAVDLTNLPLGRLYYWAASLLVSALYFGFLRLIMLDWKRASNLYAISSVTTLAVLGLLSFGFHLEFPVRWVDMYIGSAKLEFDRSRSLVPGEPYFDLIAISMLSAGIILLYFLPSVIAVRRNHKESDVIVGINLILGVTGLGWGGALAWALAGETMSGCPACGERVQDDATKCHCGHDLRYRSSISHPDEAGDWPCPACKGVNSASTHKCVHCSYSLV